MSFTKFKRPPHHKLLLKEFEPTRHPLLKHPRRIKLPTNHLQLRLIPRPIPINRILRAIRIIQINPPIRQITLLGFRINCIENPIGGSGDSIVVRSIGPLSRDEHEDERFCVLVESEWVTAGGGGFGVDGWREWLEDEGVDDVGTRCDGGDRGAEGVEGEVEEVEVVFVGAGYVELAFGRKREF